MQQWLIQHQQVAMQQVHKLQGVLANTQMQAKASAENAVMHRQNIDVLAQKGEQYRQQLASLESKLADVGLEPEVCKF